MKWIKIQDAKVKFNQQYLIASNGSAPKTGNLYKSEETATGIEHHFIGDDAQGIKGVTHVAAVSDPNAAKLVG